MNLKGYSPREIGMAGEAAATEYLRRQGFQILARNLHAKFGELDIVAAKGESLHLVEVKSLRCQRFPGQNEQAYDPGENLHMQKVRKVVRMAQWYVATVGWEGDWQVDAALIWLREHDGMARIRYYPQIL